LFVDFVQTLQPALHVEIITASSVHFEADFELFANRPDKEWSLTDCISFALMRRRDLTEALASDRHFEQAGFRRLLREE